MNSLPFNALNDEVVDDLKAILGERFQDMVAEQAQQAKLYMDEIKIALTNNEPEVAMKRAHALKSSCNQVGLSGIAAIAKELEFSCRTDIAKGTVSETPGQHLNTFRAHFPEAVAALQRRIGVWNPPKQADQKAQ